MPKRPTRRSLRDIASMVDYHPAEFTLRRLAADVRRVSAWGEDISRGLVPADIGHLRINDAIKLYKREASAIEKRERAWASYFYPQMRAVETDLEVSGEIGLLDLLKNAGRRADPDDGTE